MTRRADARAAILHQASELFMQQGYAATSIKQIAKAVGCTTATLYYYFEQGKSQILHDVIRSQSLANILRAPTDQATTLEEVLQQLGHAFAAQAPETLRRVNWLLLEYPHLADADRAVLHTQIEVEQALLTQQIARFVADETEARAIAWAFFCTYLGYGQILRASGVAELAAPQAPAFTAMLASLLGRSARS
jgi:AcrR family transcriptional regulator